MGFCRRHAPIGRNGTDPARGKNRVRVAGGGENFKQNLVPSCYIYWGHAEKYEKLIFKFAPSFTIRAKIAICAGVRRLTAHQTLFDCA